MQTFAIRPALLQDREAILQCLATAFAPYRCQYTAQAFSDTVLDAESFAVRFRTMTLFVAELNGEIVGTIGCVATGNEGHIRGMAVVEECQGSGVARSLLGIAEEELRRRGCTCVTLDTTRPLQRAIRFYENHGYAATGRVIDFFGMPLYEYAKPLHDD